MRKRSQMMPPMGDPMAGGMPPMGDPMAGGMPPMGGMPGPQAPPGPSPIVQPLEGVGEILFDIDVDELIASHPESDITDLATMIWTEYGGNPDGSSDPLKVGTRKRNPSIPAEQMSADIEGSEGRRWERLPKGKTIADITSLQEIEGLVSSMIYGVIKKHSQPAAPPGGGMLPMASAKTDMMKLSKGLHRNDIYNMIRSIIN